MTKKEKLKAIKDLKDRGYSNVAIARQLDLKPSEIRKLNLEWN
jgi:transposase-like protein